MRAYLIKLQKLDENQSYQFLLPKGANFKHLHRTIQAVLSRSDEPIYSFNFGNHDQLLITNDEVRLNAYHEFINSSREDFEAFNDQIKHLPIEEQTKIFLEKRRPVYLPHYETVDYYFERYKTINYLDRNTHQYTLTLTGMREYDGSFPTLDTDGNESLSLSQISDINNQLKSITYPRSKVDFPDLNLLIDYVIALTRLYGIVSPKMVFDIYNEQNDVKLSAEAMLEFGARFHDPLERLFVYQERGYFVWETIVEFNEFDKYFIQKQGKPYYIPPKDILVQYTDADFFESTTAHQRFEQYLLLNHFKNDPHKAREFLLDVILICEMNEKPNFQEIFDFADHQGIIFNNEKDVNEFVKMIMDIANHTRLWVNNGHTPSELFKHEKKFLKPLPATFKKVGRNEPCPCGSGKKYKHCCLNK